MKVQIVCHNLFKKTNASFFLILRSASSGSLSSSSSAEHRLIIQDSSRPLEQSELLVSRLSTWVLDAWSAHPTKCFWPMSFVVDQEEIACLAVAKSNTFKHPRDVTQLLHQTEEWHESWATTIFDLIRDFDAEVTGADPNSSSPDL